MQFRMLTIDYPKKRWKKLRDVNLTQLKILRPQENVLLLNPGFSQPNDASSSQRLT